MVVVPEPAVKCPRAFLARAVDGAVGPAGEQRADEALGLAVRLWTIGAGAQVADAERAAGERVQRGDVGGPVVGQQALDRDPVAGVVGARSAQEANRRLRLLVRQHLGIGEPAVIVDRDVHELPADGLPAATLGVDARVVVVLAQTVADALAGTALDPPEPLDVDVHELAGPRALVADRLLEPDPPQPTEAEAAQDAGDRRERHLEHLSDLGRGQAQRAQGDDRLDPLAGRAVGDSARSRGAIEQASIALQAVATRPFARAAHADAGVLGRRLQRPSLDDHPFGQLPPAAPAECRVTVELHPVSSLDWGALQPSASTRMNQRA